MVSDEQSSHDHPRKSTRCSRGAGGLPGCHVEGAGDYVASGEGLQEENTLRKPQQEYEPWLLFLFWNRAGGKLHSEGTCGFASPAAIENEKQKVLGALQKGQEAEGHRGWG